jgi:hypothetical protein
MAMHDRVDGCGNGFSPEQAGSLSHVKVIRGKTHVRQILDSGESQLITFVQEVM